MASRTMQEQPVPYKGLGLNEPGLSRKIVSKFFTRDRYGKQVVETIYASSSNIRFMNYNGAEKTLTVGFKSGHVYAYAQVPPYAWNALKKSGSIGVYFYHNIRTRFVYRKIK